MHNNKIYPEKKETDNSIDVLSNLVNDVWTEIIGFLQFHEIMNLRLVCKSLKRMLNQYQGYPQLEDMFNGLLRDDLVKYIHEIFKDQLDHSSYYSQAKRQLIHICKQRTFEQTPKGLPYMEPGSQTDRRFLDQYFVLRNAIDTTIDNLTIEKLKLLYKKIERILKDRASKKGVVDKISEHTSTDFSIISQPERMKKYLSNQKCSKYLGLVSLLSLTTTLLSSALAGISFPLFISDTGSIPLRAVFGSSLGTSIFSFVGSTGFLIFFHNMNRACKNDNKNIQAARDTLKLLVKFIILYKSSSGDETI